MGCKEVFICYRIGVLFCALLQIGTMRSQDTEGNIITDPKKGCKVWYKHYFLEDSITWSGKCVEGYAEGKGTLLGFTKGKLTSVYKGNLKMGKPHGKGKFDLGFGRKLNGNFSHGEPLFLKKRLLMRLQKNIVSNTDTNEIYVGDNNQKVLYYHALLPKEEIRGAVFLLPGTWETTEHTLSSNQALCEMLIKKKVAVFVLSVNQRLTLTDEILSLLNKMMLDAITSYAIPKNRIILGGWSMGGLFSLRYTELAYSDSTRTAIKPCGVFSCDGPCDLENIYHMFQLKLSKYPNNSEAIYGIQELKKYCGGTPDEAREKYRNYSCFSHALKNGGNARFLNNIPVRIYNDLDANWWMENRGLDMYFMNGLDQTAMIQVLKEVGNTKAEFINSYQKGYRLEGNRHPHSWSIVEPKSATNWILKTMGL